MKNFIRIALFAVGSIAAQQQPLTKFLETANRGEPINLGEVINTMQIPLPKEITSVLSKVAISAPKVERVDTMDVISGTLQLFDQTFQGALRIAPSGGSITIGLPEGFSFAKINPQLKALDTLRLVKGALVLSNIAYNDPNWGVAVGTGLNFIMTIKVEGKIEKLTRAAGANLTELTVSGTVAPKLAGSKFIAQLPGQLTLGPLGKTTGLILSLFLTESAPGTLSVDPAITTGLEINIPGDPTPVRFLGELRLKLGATVKLYISGYMEGYYDNAFTIKGLRLGQFGIGIDSDIPAAIETSGALIVSGFCLKGGVGIGRKTLEATGCVDYSTTPQLLIDTKFTGGLYIIDVVNFGIDMAKFAAAFGGKKLTIKEGFKKKIPHIGFKTLGMKIIPQATTFAGVAYEKGVEVEGEAEILKHMFSMNLKVSENGVTGQGSTSKFTFGPLTISGAGAGEKEGPVAQVNIDPTKGQLGVFLDANVALDVLGGIKGGTHIDLSPAGLSFALTADVYKQFSAYVKVDAAGAISESAMTLKPDASPAAQEAAKNQSRKNLALASNFGIEVKFNQAGLKKLGKLVSDKAKLMIMKAKEDLKKGQEEVKKLDTQLADLDKKIAAADAKDKELETQNLDRIKKAQAKLGNIKGTRTKLDAAIARCKGKKPKKTTELEEFSTGPDLSPEDIEKALEEMKKEDTTIPAETLEKIKQESLKSAAS